VKALGGRRPAGRPPLVAEANPAHPDVLPDFRFFAVVKTWMDEDVVEATVRNAMIQGAEAVYVVDNGSTDQTVNRARSAGAVLAESYATDVFEGRISQVLINAVIARQSLACGAAHVWWLLLDSDEFPEGPEGRSLVDYLRGLDRRFRVVGSHYVNHFPSGKPEYLPGFHPIDFQPLCEPFAPAERPPCSNGHWKHPLQRFDRTGLFLTSSEGFHSANVRTGQSLLEPLGGVVTHHFQYRDEALTRAKLDWTCGPGSTRTSLHESLGYKGFSTRLASLDAVYRGRWNEVETIPNRLASAGEGPRPWPGVERVLRWYDGRDVAEARQRWMAQSDLTHPRG
jgi:glycosyltransferase involved in cell wall biosynthesis